MRRREFIAGLGGTALALPLAARAQGYPHKLVKIILPYTAGSPNDVIARFIAPHLSLRLRKPVIIENRAGGGTSFGAKAVRAAEPDGYTLLFSNSPTHVIASLGSASFSYDPLEAFVPIAMVGSSSLVLVIAPGVPASSVQELVAFAKAHPGKLNFGFGQGTLPHLVGELFKVATGTDIVSIPYRGGAQAVSDMLGGRIEMNFGSGSTLLPLIREGKLRRESRLRRPQGQHGQHRFRTGRRLAAGLRGIDRKRPAQMGSDCQNHRFSGGVNGPVHASAQSARLPCGGLARRRLLRPALRAAAARAQIAPGPGERVGAVAIEPRRARPKAEFDHRPDYSDQHEGRQRVIQRRAQILPECAHDAGEDHRRQREQQDPPAALVAVVHPFNRDRQQAVDDEQAHESEEDLQTGGGKSIQGGRDRREVEPVDHLREHKSNDEENEKGNPPFGAIDPAPDAKQQMRPIHVPFSHLPDKDNQDNTRLPNLS
jgi:Tripartite tricarboxylate transporter family receptor